MYTSLTRPQFLFYFACIPMRLLLAYIAYSIPKQYLPYFGLLLLVPAIGFLTLYVFGLRQYAPEAQGKTWWNYMRPIHGLLYLLASYGSFYRAPWVWKVLLCDVIVGVGSSIRHHFL